VAYGRFSVIERLACGAFSVVYKVADLESQQELALKVELFNDRPCAMLAHEYCVSQLVSSPFICHFFGTFESDVSCAVAMELLSATLIDVRRKRVNPPPLPMLINVTLQCLQGLIALHNAGIVHSDVKPSNFAFRCEGNAYRVVTFDFGLSQYAQECADITAFRAALKRNPRYVSLRFHSENVWDAPDDIVSLIYTISEFWKDELPWDGRTTPGLVLEVKKQYPLSSFLPPELQFLADSVGAPEADIAARLEQILLEYTRDIESELHYIFDPPDTTKRPKLVKYIFEPGVKPPSNQHSA
jgi:serine/threonine protein kinase